MEQLDYKELAARTHLDARRIKAVMERDFAALEGANVPMTLKILERELGEDFTAWREEYAAWSAEHQSVHNVPKIAPKVQGYTGDGPAGRGISGGWLAAILLLCAIGGGIGYYHEQLGEFVESFELFDRSQGASAAVMVQSPLEQSSASVQISADVAAQSAAAGESASGAAGTTGVANAASVTSAANAANAAGASEKPKPAQDDKGAEPKSSEQSGQKSTEPPSEQERAKKSILRVNLAEQAQSSTAPQAPEPESAQINKAIFPAKTVVLPTASALDKSEQIDKSASAERAATAAQASAAEAATTAEPTAAETTSEQAAQTAVLKIIPNQVAWLSIKDLASGKTRNFAATSPHKITSASLIFVGTTAYALELGGKKAPNAGRYFVFDGQRVKFLSKAEYSAMNKGARP